MYVYIQEPNLQLPLLIVTAMILRIVMLCILVEEWTVQMKLLLQSSERLLVSSENGVAGTLKCQTYVPNITLLCTKFLQLLRSMIKLYF